MHADSVDATTLRVIYMVVDLKNAIHVPNDI